MSITVAFLVAQLVKNPPAMQEEDLPVSGRSPGEGNSYQLQYSGLENSMNCIVYGVTKSQTQLSDSLSPYIVTGTFFLLIRTLKILSPSF